MNRGFTAFWIPTGVALLLLSVARFRGWAHSIEEKHPAGSKGLSFVSQDLHANHDLQKVFFGENRAVYSTWKNASDQKRMEEINIHLIQTTSSTATSAGQVRWKALELLPGQMVVETAQVSFPPVRGETRFLVQWINFKNEVRGTTSVLVYPSDLLKELKSLAGEGGPGIFDPCNALKPVLKNLSIDFVDLREHGLDEFRGRLAILGPFSSKTQITERLVAQIHTALEQKMGIVWMQPPPGPRSPLTPSFYIVPGSNASLLVAQASLGGDYAQDPGAQIRLLELCRLALHPKPLSFPDFSQ